MTRKKTKSINSRALLALARRPGVQYVEAHMSAGVIRATHTVRYEPQIHALDDGVPSTVRHGRIVPYQPYVDTGIDDEEVRTTAKDFIAEYPKARWFVDEVITTRNQRSDERNPAKLAYLTKQRTKDGALKSTVHTFDRSTWLRDHYARCWTQFVARVRLTQAFFKRWPKACWSCYASGHDKDYYEDVAGDGKGSMHFDGEPCSDCMQEGKCPRCGRQFAPADAILTEQRGLAHFYARIGRLNSWLDHESDEWMSHDPVLGIQHGCPKCGWNWEDGSDDTAPAEFDCEGCRR